MFGAEKVMISLGHLVVQKQAEFKNLQNDF